MRRRRRINLARGSYKALHYIFGTEIWPAFLIFIIQDLPFLVHRIIIIASYRLSQHYTIYFFVVKNFVLCCAEIYKIVVVFIEINKEHAHQSKKENKNVEIEL